MYICLQQPLSAPVTPETTSDQVKRYEERIETLTYELESLRVALARKEEEGEQKAEEVSVRRPTATEARGVQVDCVELGADGGRGAAWKRVGVPEERSETSDAVVQTELSEETTRESTAAQTDEESPQVSFDYLRVLI